MAIKNRAKEVKDRINEMLAKRKADLKTIEDKEKENRVKLSAVEKELKKAADEIDADAYETATAKKRKIDITLDMLRDKYNMIEHQEYISENESDKVIDGLLQYEKDLEEDFKKAIEDPLQQLVSQYKNYINAVREAENTITLWSNNIHANYNTRGRSSYVDPVTGVRVYRSKNPIPVRVVPFDGCAEAERLGSYLKKEKLV